MTDRVGRYIRDEQLLTRDGVHLVALSGGADSVALLRVLMALGYSVEAAHCNFHLRGAESDRDEQFVVSLCDSLAIPLHRAHFDTKAYAALHHVSIEMAARELRYRYFEQLRHDIGAATVCVAHHRDDAVETLLMNLVRGTGIHGLTGIRPRNGYVVRPLLCVSRHEIESWLDSIGQPYVTDSTNLTADVVRNKMRLEVIPLLNSINAAASANIARTASNIAEAEKVYNQAIAQETARLLSAPDALGVQTLSGTPSESALHEILSARGFNATQCVEIHGLLVQGPASAARVPNPHPRFLSDRCQAVVDGGRLLLGPLPEELPVMRIPETGTYHYKNGMKLRFTVVEGNRVDKRPAVATLDACKAPFPLVVRPIAGGDRFCPYGMKGQQLVSNYLTDRKQTVFARQQQLVVTASDGRIVWLVGHRTDQRAAVTANTTEVLVIEIMKE